MTHDATRSMKMSYANVQNKTPNKLKKKAKEYVLQNH